jgi:hypothetical protein
VHHAIEGIVVAVSGAAKKRSVGVRFGRMVLIHEDLQFLGGNYEAWFG